MSFSPPENGARGIYRCRTHYHIGLLWPKADDNGDFWEYNDLEWMEMSPGMTFENASNRLMRLWEADITTIL